MQLKTWLRRNYLRKGEALWPGIYRFAAEAGVSWLTVARSIKGGRSSAECATRMHDATGGAVPLRNFLRLRKPRIARAA